jgi:hypothetical protein
LSFVPNPGATNLCFIYRDGDLFKDIVQHYELENEIPVTKQNVKRFLYCLEGIE